MAYGLNASSCNPLSTVPQNTSRYDFGYVEITHWEWFFLECVTFDHALQNTTIRGHKPLSLSINPLQTFVQVTNLPQVALNSREFAKHKLYAKATWIPFKIPLLWLIWQWNPVPIAFLSHFWYVAWRTTCVSQNSYYVSFMFDWI